MTKKTGNYSQNETILDVDLFKIIGLYRLLHKPSIRNGQWGSGDWYRTLFKGMFWLLCGLQSLQIIRLYLTVNDLQIFLFTGLTVIFSLVNAFKGYVLLKYADRILAMMDVTQYSFTLCSRRDPSYLRQYKNVLLPLLRSFLILSFIMLVQWIVAPLFIHDYVPYVNLDGTIGHYRASVNNVWLPLSENIYNYLPVWALIYIVESVNCFMTILFSSMFDCCLLTMCIALDAHLRTMITAFATLGSGDQHQGFSTELESKFYDELILYIKCNQKIIKIYDEFFDIIRPVLICKIMCETYISITLIYSVLLLCLTGSSVMSLPILKFFGTYGWYLIQLYAYCYVFDHLETTKSKLNNGLWNGNWTGRNLKFRKTMLVAMIINSSHTRKMRASPTWIVNLEMFMRVMKISYTVVSVLINTRDKYT